MGVARLGPQEPRHHSFIACRHRRGTWNEADRFVHLQSSLSRARGRLRNRRPPPARVLHLSIESHTSLKSPSPVTVYSASLCPCVSQRRITEEEQRMTDRCLKLGNRIRIAALDGNGTSGGFQRSDMRLLFVATPVDGKIKVMHCFAKKTSGNIQGYLSVE